MELQSTGGQESPVDPWEVISDDSVDVDGSPSLSDSDHPPCPTDVRFTRHKATWINPQGVQPQLQDLCPLVATVGKSGRHFVADTTSPSGPSPASLGDSQTETPLLEDPPQHSLDSCSACGSREKTRDLSLSSTEERALLPGSSLPGSPFTGSKILATSPCLEADELAVLAGADQVNRRAISLNSFLPEAFVFPVDVEKENAHFYVADMIISVMEKIKYNILSQQQTENWSVDKANESLGNDQVDPEVTFNAKMKQESVSSTSPDSGYEGCGELKVSPVLETPPDCDVVKEACKCDFDEFAILELGELKDTTETCGCSYSSSKSGIYEPDFNSAERIARELYRVFRKCWLLSEVNYQPASSLNAAGSIVVNEDRVRKEFESSVEVVQEIKVKSRIRGTDDWAPPRFQIIFNIHPPLKVCEAAPLLRVPGEVLLRLLPHVCRVLHPGAHPDDVGLPEVLRQQFRQKGAGQHMVPAHFQFAGYQPEPLFKSQGTGQSEGNAGAAFSYQEVVVHLQVCQKREASRETWGPHTTKKAAPRAECILWTWGSCTEKLLDQGKIDDKDLSPELHREKAFPWNWHPKFGLLAY
ncbi:protein associated with UVRAG as autophagy enhancer isoform X7 [Loxodonta africana]|uniref:protein associated with UVRAG as autophagy enhancer isoform X7 n=1 Tax=Loxodonta africana TaxID=9785 RepID=UPI0030D540EB